MPAWIPTQTPPRFDKRRESGLSKNISQHHRVARSRCCEMKAGARRAHWIELIAKRFAQQLLLGANAVVN